MKRECIGTAILESDIRASHRRPRAVSSSRHSRLCGVLPYAFFLCVLSVRAASGPAWKNIGPGGGGWFQTIAISPHAANQMFVGGDVGGLYKSTDGGATYRISNTGLQDYWVERVVFHPTDPNLIYLGCQSGPYRSTDGGETWEWIRDGFPSPKTYTWSAPIGALAIDPTSPTTLYAGIGRPRPEEDGQGAVYKTTDGGDNWYKVNASGSLPSDAVISDLLIDVRNRRHLYLACWSEHAPADSGVYQSYDAGATWSQTVSGLPHRHVRRLAQCAGSPAVLYVTLRTELTDNDTTWVGGVYKSTDGGNTWTARNSGLDKKFDPSSRSTICGYDRIVVHPADPDIAYVGGTSWWNTRMYKTTDGGASWSRKENFEERGWIRNGPGPKDICLSPHNPDVLWFCTSMMVFKSSDGANSWHQKYCRTFPDGRTQTTGLEITCAQHIAVDPSNPLRVYVSYADVGLLVSDDGGQTFWPTIYDLPSAARGNAYGVVFDPHDSDHCWATVQGDDVGLIESHDHGRTWSIVGSAAGGLPGNRPAVCVDPNSPAGATRLFAAPAGYGMYRSDDNGHSWTPCSNGLSTTSPKAIVAHPSVPDTFFCASSSKIFRTTDGGQQWQQVSATLGTRAIQQMAIAPSLPDRLYLSARYYYDHSAGKGYKGGIYRSDDGGVDWSLVFEDDFMEGLAVDPFDADLVYAGSQDHPYHDGCTGDGLFRTTDGGATWEPLNGEGLTHRCIAYVALSPHDHTALYVAAGGNGVFKGRVGNVGLRFTPAASADDAEERLDTGAVSLGSSDLELVTEAAPQLVGIRFRDVQVPSGVTIGRAYVQFTVDETSSGPTALTIHGQDTDNAAAFATQAGNISARQTTSASVSWTVPAWTAVGLAGTAQQTPDLATVIQQIIDRPGWAPGNALALLVSGNGKRVAESYDGSTQKAPVLWVEFVPAAPDAVAATPLSTSRIAVSWADRSENEDGFKIERRRSGTPDWLWLTTVPADTTGHEDSGLPADTKFYYRIRAYNPLGESAPSGVADGRTLQNPPVPPSELAAIALSATAVEFSWADNSYNEEGFRIDRRQSGTSGWLVMSAAADATQYLDAGLSAGAKYYYKATALHSGVGDSPTVGPVAATTALGPGAFTAYNDLAWFAGQPDVNITRYTRGQKGLLVEHATGAPVGALLAIDQGGTGPQDSGSSPVPGTDAHAVFDGKLDPSGVIGYGNDLTLRFSGLTNALRYTLVLYGDRGVSSYTDRRTLYTIHADGFVNRSSGGTYFAGPADPAVSVRNGYNTLRGHVGRFEGIDPGHDGAFEIVVSDGGSAAPPKFYVGALMLKAEEGQVPAVEVGNHDVWQYRKGTGEASAPAGAWRDGAGPHDLPGWTTGPAPFGYGSETYGTEFTDMRGTYSCVFLRKTFDIDAPALVSRIELNVRHDDGFIAWLNGQEVARVNVGGAVGSFVPFDATADTHTAGPESWSTNLLGAAIPPLVAGTNVLAIQAFNISLGGSSDLMIDAALLTLTGSDFALAEDPDRDGIPDDWESAFLSDLSDGSELAAADPDNDGMSNIEEYVAGTSPRDETGNLKLETRLSGASVIVSLPTVVATGPGYEGLTRRYALETRDTDPASTWLPVAGFEDIAATGETVDCTVSDPDKPGLYRARVWLE